MQAENELLRDKLQETQLLLSQSKVELERLRQVSPGGGGGGGGDMEEDELGDGMKEGKVEVKGGEEGGKAGKSRMEDEEEFSDLPRSSLKGV